MKLTFIRHAKALKREEWSEDDLLRPLSSKGIKEANIYFKEYSKILKNVDSIFTSKATRSKESGALLKRFIEREVLENELLNPGRSVDGFRKFYLSLDKSTLKNIVIIGHEPDLSEIISSIVSSQSFANFKIKKCSMLEVELFDIDKLVGSLNYMVTGDMFSN